MSFDIQAAAQSLRRAVAASAGWAGALRGRQEWAGAHSRRGDCSGHSNGRGQLLSAGVQFFAAGCADVQWGHRAALGCLVCRGPVLGLLGGAVIGQATPTARSARYCVPLGCGHRPVAGRTRLRHRAAGRVELVFSVQQIQQAALADVELLAVVGIARLSMASTLRSSTASWSFSFLMSL